MSYSDSTTKRPLVSFCVYWLNYWTHKPNDLIRASRKSTRCITRCTWSTRRVEASGRALDAALTVHLPGRIVVESNCKQGLLQKRRAMWQTMQPWRGSLIKHASFTRIWDQQATDTQCSLSCIKRTVRIIVNRTRRITSA